MSRLAPAVLGHLRQHVVAYLALVVALSGTAYAAGVPPRNSVGHQQLKSGSVRSAEVKNRSLRAVDFARGQLPRGPVGPIGPSWVSVKAGVGDPAATFETALGGAVHQFDAPRAGTYVVEAFVNLPWASCSVAGAQAGLYVDGVPVAGTQVALAGNASSSLPLLLRGVVTLAAGDRTALVGLDCPSGSWTSAQSGADSWEVQLVGGS